MPAMSLWLAQLFSCFFFGIRTTSLGSPKLQKCNCSGAAASLLVINEMDLGERTRCISITWALLIIVCQTMCESVYVGESPSQNFATALSAVYHSHRILFLTGLGTLTLSLLGCLGCLCCTCSRLARRKVDSLDIYAPRTQSIVWPPIPAETARVLELTFLHTPNAVDCICRICSRARREHCLEDCLNGTEC